MILISKTYVKATPEHAESWDCEETGFYLEDLISILYEMVSFIIETSPALIYTVDYFGLNYSAEEDYYNFNSDNPSKSRQFILSYGIKTIDLIIKLL